jgi:hypothetical protein
MSDLVNRFMAGELSGAEVREATKRLQAELAMLPQYEPKTTHHFHGGMYCREVQRSAGVLVVGKVHRKEHFYMVVAGTILVTTDEGALRITGPQLIKSMPGTKRAVYSETDAICMTFHRTDAVTVEAAEIDLIEEGDDSMFDAGNLVKSQTKEVTS